MAECLLFTLTVVGLTSSGPGLDRTPFLRKEEGRPLRPPLGDLPSRRGPVPGRGAPSWGGSGPGLQERPRRALRAPARLPGSPGSRRGHRAPPRGVDVKATPGGSREPGSQAPGALAPGREGYLPVPGPRDLGSRRSPDLAVPGAWSPGLPALGKGPLPRETGPQGLFYINPSRGGRKGQNGLFRPKTPKKRVLPAFSPKTLKIAKNRHF